MKRILLLFLIVFLLVIPVSAEKAAEDEIIDIVDDELSKFESSLPDYVKDFLPNEVFDGDFSSIINNEIGQSSFLEYTINYLLSFLPSTIKSFSNLLVLILISSIFNVMKESFMSDGLKTAFSMCSTLCISISVFSIISTILSRSIDFIGALCGAMNSFAPVMSILYIISGSITSAAISNASMMLFLSIIENFIVYGLAPIVNICLCFSIVSSISCGTDLTGIAKSIKNMFTSICVFLVSIFSFVMSYQSVLSRSADSLSLRTARFAIGNFIPVVGGFVSDSIATISSSLGLIKSSCGTIAIIVILLLTIPIIISIWLNKISFSLCSGISKALSVDRDAQVFDEACTICSFILAIVTLCSVIFIFALTIFIKSSVVIS